MPELVTYLTHANHSIRLLAKAALEGQRNFSCSLTFEAFFEPSLFIKQMVVNGEVYFKNVSLDILEDLTVYGNLYFSQCNITKVENLKVKGSFFIEGYLRTPSTITFAKLENVILRNSTKYVFEKCQINSLDIGASDCTLKKCQIEQLEINYNRADLHGITIEDNVKINTLICYLHKSEIKALNEYRKEIREALNKKKISSTKIEIVVLEHKEYIAKYKNTYTP